jgi:hypothetical protein
MHTWPTNNLLTNGRAEEIVDYINTLSELFRDGVNVVYMSSEGPPVSIVIHDMKLYHEVVALGETLSTNN